MKSSAGILVYRYAGGAMEVLLAHPGGPFWAKRDAGAWSIPKGEIEAGEEGLAAAVREFAEETGIALTGVFLPLGSIRQKGGKVVHAFAHERDLDPTTIRSNTCEIEWPPRSGRKLMIPEIDRAAWLGLAQARQKIIPAQLPFLERLAETPARQPSQRHSTLTTS